MTTVYTLYVLPTFEGTKSNGTIGCSVVSWSVGCTYATANGTVSLVIIDDVTTEKSSDLGNVFICSFSAKCVTTHWMAGAVEQCPKAYCESNQRVFEGREVERFAMTKSITWTESDWACWAKKICVHVPLFTDLSVLVPPVTIWDWHRKINKATLFLVHK